MALSFELLQILQQLDLFQLAIRSLLRLAEVFRLRKCRVMVIFIYLSVNIDLEGNFLLDSGYTQIGFSEIYVDDFYYLSYKIPLSLTEAETQAVMAVLEKK